MPIALQKVHALPARDMTVVIRNHRDNVVQALVPGEASVDFGGRWLDQGTKFTELNISNSFGRQATIILEDDRKWNFVVSGDVNGGKKSVAVDGSKDFDIFIKPGGRMEFMVRNGSWNGSQGPVVRIDILPFSR